MAVLRKISQMLIIIGIVAISFFSFANVRQFDIRLNQPNETRENQLKRIDSGPFVLDAQTLLGNNFTDIFSKTAASFVMALYPDGPSTVPSETPIFKLPMDTISTIAGEEVGRRVLQEQKIFSLENITTVDDSTDNIFGYIANLKKIRKEYLDPFKSYDLLLLADAANHQNNTQARTALLRYTEASEKAINRLESMPVPDSFVELHISFMNILNESNYIALGLLLENNDPVRTLLAARAYPLLGAKYVNFTQEFAKTLSKNGLVM